MTKKKKIILSIIVVLIIVVVAFFLGSKVMIPKLPLPEITGGSRGELGIDKNINESTIDKYLNRKDSVYRDMRMLEDPGNYEAIGGDSFLSGYIKGFEVIPLPYIIPIDDLPNEVGATYTGTTLFYNDNGTYVANYNESMDIIEEIFPKDKVIFLMCGGGGYAGMTKNFLVSLGWDENKIYNVGGYWYYDGKNNITLKKNDDNTYNFENVPYHEIDFSKLTKATNYKKPVLKVAQLKINTKELELEKGTSFKLNVIVLPNEAINKEVVWKSSDTSVAIVNDEGLVRATGVGKAIITVETTDGKKSVSCEVKVNEIELTSRIVLDDLTKEAEEFASFDPGKIDVGDWIDFDSKEYEKRWNQAIEKRANIFNKLIDDKKSFIVLVHSNECIERDYSFIDGAKKFLEDAYFNYFEMGDVMYNGEEYFQNSKIGDGYNSDGTIVIVKDGEIYAKLNPNIDAINNDEDLRNWFSKYIGIN